MLTQSAILHQNHESFTSCIKRYLKLWSTHLIFYFDLVVFFNGFGIFPTRDITLELKWLETFLIKLAKVINIYLCKSPLEWVSYKLKPFPVLYLRCTATRFQGNSSYQQKKKNLLGLAAELARMLWTMDSTTLDSTNSYLRHSN